MTTRSPSAAPSQPSPPEPRRADPDDPSTWTPRPRSAARITVVVLQSIALGLIGLAFVAAIWWLVTSSGGAQTGTLVSAILVVPVAAALLWLGWTGLRRWLAGGPPMRLYGFDALPVIFIVATAGPGAFQDLIGIAIALAFIVPGMVTALATNP
ncbi:MAG TPA: hypothetical protein VFW02_08805 [Candidatus Limnocylindrales bacterium]|nr:hypothetical protein [Candidatus Limnocylindrales bacterium]